MIAEVTSAGISTGELAALRQAESLALHHIDEHGSIRCYLRGRVSEPRVFTRREQLVFPDTEYGGFGDRSRLISCHGEGLGYETPISGAWRLPEEPKAVCFASLDAARFEPVWRTVVDVLRSGDRLSLRWVADNNTATIREAGLHADQLTLLAVRGTTSTARQFAFTLAHSITPDNTARMIQRHGYR